MLRLLAALTAALTVTLSAFAAAAEQPAAFDAAIFDAAVFDSVVARFAKDSQFSGVVLVADQGRPIYRQAFGLANREWSVPMTPGTRFRVASVTKTFTALLIMQAMQAGKLKPGTTVASVLPEYAQRSFAGVTIDQLLTYSSGLPTTDQTSGMGPYQQAATPKELIALWANGPLTNAPGEKFAYKNLDYLLLGRVLEAVEGTSFRSLLDQRIVQPLGLDDTGYLDSARLLPRLASAYFVDDDDKSGTLHPDLPYYPENYDAAGAMYSTADDLLKFDSALRTTRLLDPEHTARMLEPHEALGHVAYGFWVYPCSAAGEKTHCAERQGSILGSNALWLRDLDRGRSYIVLANDNRADLQKLKGLLLGLKP